MCSVLLEDSCDFAASKKDIDNLVLSLFTGVGLMDRAFSHNGFVVVSSGDIITGQDIREFTGIKNRFDGIIAGSPCQDFSSANRDRPGVLNSYGFQMLNEFKRIVLECDPTWALLENVPGVPDILIEGYEHQRIDINQSWYEDVNRLRHIQFYRKEGFALPPIQIDRGVTTPGKKIKSCALASDHRTFKELKKLQGLPDDYDLLGFTVAGKKRAVGNGLPYVMGCVLSRAVKDCVIMQYDKSVTMQHVKYCKCGCGRIVTGRFKYYDYSCRKRAQRKRNKNVK